MLAGFRKILVLFNVLQVVCLNAQISTSGCTLNGGMSNGKTTGCGNSPTACNLAAVYSFFGTFCGTSVVSASGGHVTATSNLILPAGCNATVSVEMRQRTNIHATGCNNGGMDGSDAISITNSGGIISSQGATLCCSGANCAAYPTLVSTPVTFPTSNIPTGCSNANGIARMEVSGGTVTISGTSDRADEITTFTITLNESTCGPNCNQVLPIELSDFYGYRADNSVALKWQVKKEINLKHYLLERSSDGAEFSPLAEISPLMPSNAQIFSYQHYDEKPLRGINYYRLTNVDVDGSKQQHPIIAVNFDGQTSNLWHSESATEITIGLNQLNYQSEFELLDMSGKLIKTIDLSQGTCKISKEALSPGIYYIKDTSGHQSPYKLMVFN